jgi:flagellar biosynthesis protein FliQ
MNNLIKKSALNLAVASALTLGVATSALAATVGGSIAQINDQTLAFVTGIAVVAAVGQNDTVILSGTINNNMAAGWNLKVDSANSGILKRGLGGVGNQINYGSIKLVQTGGILGNGLTNPTTSDQDVSSGSTTFVTTTAATSATVGYAYDLQISWAADTALLEGSYTDAITVVLSTDS